MAMSISGEIPIPATSRLTQSAMRKASALGVLWKVTTICESGFNATQPRYLFPFGPSTKDAGKFILLASMPTDLTVTSNHVGVLFATVNAPKIALSEKETSCHSMSARAVFEGSTANLCFVQRTEGRIEFPSHRRRKQRLPSL